MKKLVICLLFLCACGDSIKIEGKKYDCYGFANKENREEFINYDWSVGNLFWGIVFSETIIIPIWLAGWEWYCPIEVIQPLLPKTGA